MGSLVAELMAELMGMTCRCGRPKRSKNTFCSACYAALPKAMQRALYQRCGHGYEEAYAAAVVELSNRRFRSPAGGDAREVA